YWSKLSGGLADTVQEYFENYIPDWLEKVKIGLTALPSYTDTGIEGLLTYVFLFKIEQMPIQEFLEFLNYNSEDVGYPWDEESRNRSSFHASLIALWLVCEIIDFCS
ncbi:MAG: hypothetical protein NZ108_09725, partial [Bacteroidia bacterium]|nr:hypothetical protein [Bacteroidia bacterium]